MATDQQRAAIRRRADEIAKARHEQWLDEKPQRDAAERERERDRRKMMGDAAYEAAHRIAAEAPSPSPQKIRRVGAIFDRTGCGPKSVAQKRTEQRERDLEQARAEIAAERRAMPVLDRLTAYAEKEQQ